MNKTKSQLESTTIVSSLVGLVATILQVFNLALTPEEQNGIIAAILAAIQAISFIKAWIGRIDAEHKIK